MISVQEALDKLFELVSPLPVETVPLRQGAGRVLRDDIVAKRNQPPFSASAMDGYAVAVEDPQPGQRFRVVGEAAAGHGIDTSIDADQAVRIFTGAPVPEGTKRVVIQEDVDRDGETITIGDRLDPKGYIRPAGGDFAIGSRIESPRRLGPSDLALGAAMNCAEVTVTRKPRVAVLATGDELVMPGEEPNDDQIIASNIFGLAAMLEADGADVSLLPIARDSHASLAAALSLADGADLLVTIGGASVGDHDLVAAATAKAGMDRSFYKVAMRPGKPLMAGKIGDMAVIGLPGNPVSAMVCGEVFLRPVIAALSGLPARPRQRSTMKLTEAMPANGPREHYMRAIADDHGVRAMTRQDSSLLTVLSQSNALIVRAPSDPARFEGDTVDVILIS